MEKAFCCAPDFPVVQTNYGPVRGYRFREISSFKGTPYGGGVRSHHTRPPLGGSRRGRRFQLRLRLPAAEHRQARRRTACAPPLLGAG